MSQALVGDHIPALSPVCTFCRHLRGFRRCDAFPEEIPLAIWVGDNNHRAPYPGDNGVRFERWTEAEVAEARERAEQSRLLDALAAEREPVSR
jgi:hypothetical protein